MLKSKLPVVDAVKELRLRRWARTNFVTAQRRSESWHPIVLDEMQVKDAERNEQAASYETGRPLLPYVPLAPSPVYVVHGSHAPHGNPNLIRRSVESSAARGKRSRVIAAEE